MPQTTNQQIPSTCVAVLALLTNGILTAIMIALTLAACVIVLAALLSLLGKSPQTTAHGN